MRTSWNKGLTKKTDSRLARAAEKISAAATGKAKTLEAEILRCQRISATAKSRGSTGGYRPNAGRTKKYHVLDSFGTTVCLQSTHELRLSEILDSHSIKWTREGCFRYGGKRYFPDFYLPESNIYLDVKNEYLIKIDAEKIRRVKEENPDLVLYVFTIDQAKQILGL